MEPIDYSIPDPAKTPYRNHAFRAGLIIAGISIFLSLILYLTGGTENLMKNKSLSWANNLLSFGLTLWFIYSACLQHRQQDLGGYISIGRCLGIGSLSGLIAGLISGIWTVLFMNVIAPEVLDQIKEVTMQQMADQGQSEAQIEKAMEVMKIFFTPTVFFITAAVVSTISGFFAGLISGFVVQKARPFA
ncbi:MAG: DUF4199 domain-containing protein [Bacteroidota bacterium]